VEVSIQDYIVFEVAEVLDSFNGTYKYQDGDTKFADMLFTIRVQSVNRLTNKHDIRTCRPINNNVKQIPLVGEHVLIFRAYNQETTLDKTGIEWYYFSPYSITSGVNENFLPGISYGDTITVSDVKKIVPGKTFKPKTISPLQPFEGDLLFEGRWGNSIRLGSTVPDSDRYTLQAPWIGVDIGDPIIVISNNRENLKNKHLVTENIKNDGASLYLTSTQKIPDLEFGSKQKKNPLRCYYPNESNFVNSQFIGTADRVILKAKTDIAVIDSPKAIVLNTAGEIKLGSDNATESMVHGDVLMQLLQKILNQLNTPIQCGTMAGTFIDKSNTISAQNLMQQLLSSKYFMKKNTY
jgi:hypothetical protein